MNVAVYNPRRLPPAAKAQIKASIEKFGLVDPFIVNVHPDRMNVMVGGHQRLKIVKELGYEDVPCVEVKLELADEKELNVRLNKNTGEWDFPVLRESFDTSMLIGIGFTAKELGIAESEYDRQLNAITNADADTPIVPKFDESYAMVCIFVKTEIDMNFVRHALKLDTRKSYKNTSRGESHVLTAEQLQAALAEHSRNAVAAALSEKE